MASASVKQPGPARKGPPVPKLILVDGFAGTGKSTAAQQLWLNLVRGGHDAIWFHEHEAHHPIFEYGEVEELLNYRQLAPYSRLAHPTEEHLLPLFVAMGAGGEKARGRNLHRGWTMGSLSMAAYSFD